MSNKIAVIAFASLCLYNSNAQTISDGTLNIEAGLNAYTISMSTEYKDKWLVNAGYQTNDYHFLNIEDIANNADSFKDRLYVAVLLPLLKTEKINHHLGVGAAFYGSTNTSGSAALGLTGSLNYKLTYPISDKLAASGNLYILNAQPNELSVGINYIIF